MISVETLETLLVNPKSASKNHFVAECPWCGDTHHFYIHKGINSKGIENGFDCKKCGIQGNIITFLSKLGKLSLLDGEDVDVNNPLYLNLKEEIDSRIEEPLDTDIKTIKLPVGFKPVKKGDIYYNYLLSRKFRPIDFDLYRPGYTVLLRRYFEYVIIPVFRKNEVKGYVARYIGEDEDKKRYLNSMSDFNKLLFGFDQVTNKTQTIILVEGIFDMISVTNELQLYNQNEMKCLATFGKKLTEVQLYLLHTKGVKNLFILYDGRDAVNEMKKLSFDLEKEFESVLVSYTGMNDPGNSNKEQIFQYLATAESPSIFWLSKLNRLKLKK